jgi:hypothetical protein
VAVVSRRRWAILVVGTVAVLAAGCAVLYLHYLRLPAGYIDPDTIPRPVLEARAREFRAHANRLTGHVLSGESFDVTFTDEAVNAYITTTLARTGAAWFDHLRIPDEVAQVQLTFRPGVVVVFGRLDRGWLSCVFSAALRVRVNREGELAATVARARGGRLPIPSRLVGRFLGGVQSRPLAVRLRSGGPIRLHRVDLGAGTIRLVGGPAQIGDRSDGQASPREGA